MKRILSIYLIALAAAVAGPHAAAFETADDAISLPAAATATVKIVNGGVDVTVETDEAEHVTVYAITGQVVKQLDVAATTAHIDLSPGCYIVRVGRMSQRIIVR